MYFERFTDNHLAQNAYLIGCQKTGEAIIIDPPRHTEEILQKAKQEGLDVIATAETHIHADFVSGARELAKAQDTTLYLSKEGGEDWKYDYLDDIHAVLLKDGELFSIGNIDFTVMHTPGHTPESISFLVTDRGGGATEPMGMLTGDFVFVGDVGRPDLLEAAAGISGTAETGARDMFHSLKKFKALPDYIQLWPGHGAGSACGKALGAVPASTVGYERKFNWALNINDEQTFIDTLLQDQPEAPTYFAEMKKVNKMGPDLLPTTTVPVYEDSEMLRTLLKDGNTVLLDTRPADIAKEKLIAGAINIPYGPSFANWAGWILHHDENILILAAEKEQTDILHALESIGLDGTIAFFHENAVDNFTFHKYDALTPEMFQQKLHDKKQMMLDVRNNQERKAGHFPETKHFFLGHLREIDLPEANQITVHCQSGVRAKIAASILKARGVEHVSYLDGHVNSVDAPKVRGAES